MAASQLDEAEGMPGAMTPGEDRNPDDEGDDHFAAEYVLGVLPAQELQAAARRVTTDPSFARLVEAWEGRLSPLNAGYDEVRPPASLKTALDARLFNHGRPAMQKPGLLQSLVFWRGLAAAAIAAFFLAVAIPFFPPVTTTSDISLVASLAGDRTDVRYLAVYDARSSEIRLSHLAGNRSTGHDFELWIIKGSDHPVSLGVIPMGSNAHLAVAPARRELIGSGALFAISLEPRGGSPTGQPTGPVVASGDLHAM
ncbi:anti-sigma factor [Nitrobacter sp. NHB1]|uniref:anti-sigma factor n=1 Tax=Nitrobacter sp. NHB1 TaxID=3119830 RepID=UPI002FFD9D18